MITSAAKVLAHSNPIAKDQKRCVPYRWRKVIQICPIFECRPNRIEFDVISTAEKKNYNTKHGENIEVEIYQVESSTQFTPFLRSRSSQIPLCKLKAHSVALLTLLRCQRWDRLKIQLKGITNANYTLLLCFELFLMLWKWTLLFVCGKTLT